MEGLNRARVRNPFWFRWLRLIAKRFGFLEVAHAVFSPLGALGASLPGLLALPALYLAKERGLLSPEQVWPLGILLGYASALYFYRSLGEVLGNPARWKGVYLREGVASLTVAGFFLHSPPKLEELVSGGSFDVLRPLWLILTHPLYWLLPALLGGYKLVFLLVWSRAVAYSSQESLLQEMGLPPLEVKNDSLAPSRELLSRQLPKEGEREALLWKLKEKLYVEDKVAEEVVDLVLLLRHYWAYKKHFGGVEVPRGLLLVGPPGTGKTSLARFIAEEGGVPFLHADPSTLRSKYLGESAQMIRGLFEKARSMAPCILFLDEIDAVAPRRGAHVEVDHAVSQLLTEMDGLTSQKGEAPVVVIGATNNPRGVDPAVLSRLGTIIEVPLPPREGRRRILEILLSSVPGGVFLDLEPLLDVTEGFSGRDLKELVSRAARRRFARGGGVIEIGDLLREAELMRRNR